jgi:coproporphyrinogen III oxidase-like Fe-S oxidoreductase
VEEGTPLARDIARGRVPAPDPDMQAEHYEWTQERMARAGYEHYEISNWARPGYRCRHNLIYWQNRGPWAGAGRPRSSAVAVRLPNHYISRSESLAASKAAPARCATSPARADHG